jgi:hypothetical protein
VAVWRERTAATTKRTDREETLVKLGLRTILLLAAVVVFVVAIFVDKDQVKWLTAGLALFAASFLATELRGGLGGGLRRRL